MGKWLVIPAHNDSLCQHRCYGDLLHQVGKGIWTGNRIWSWPVFPVTHFHFDSWFWAGTVHRTSAVMQNRIETKNHSAAKSRLRSDFFLLNRPGFGSFLNPGQNMTIQLCKGILCPPRKKDPAYILPLPHMPVKNAWKSTP